MRIIEHFFIYITLISAITSISLNLIFTKNGVEYAAIIYFITWLLQFLGLIFSVYYAKKNFKII